MAHGQLAEHHPDHPVQVAAGGEVGQERLVFLPHGIPVGAVHVGGVEVVAVDPPGFAEDLRPFGPRLDPHRDRIELQRAVPLVELARVHDAQNQGAVRRTGRRRIPGVAGLVEDLLAVGGKAEVIDPLGQRLLLAGLEVEPPERRLPLSFRSLARPDVHAAEINDLPLVAGGQVLDGPGRDRQRPRPGR